MYVYIDSSSKHELYMCNVNDFFKNIIARILSHVRGAEIAYRYLNKYNLSCDIHLCLEEDHSFCPVIKSAENEFGLPNKINISDDDEHTLTFLINNPLGNIPNDYRFNYAHGYFNNKECVEIYNFLLKFENVFNNSIYDIKFKDILKCFEIASTYENTIIVFS